MLKVKLYLFSLFLKFCFGRSGLCKGWDNRIVQKQKQKKTHANN